MFIVISQIVIFILLLIVKLIFIKKLYRRLDNIPLFDKSLVGKYVKFVGRVQHHNNYSIEGKNAEFYIYRVYYEWSEKLKKPSKGTARFDATILKKYGDNMLLKNRDKSVYVEYDRYFKESKKSYFLNFENKNSSIDSVTAYNIATKENIESRYEKSTNKAGCRYYKSIRYLKALDDVVVYGVLEKDEDRYIITNRVTNNLPFIISKDLDFDIKDGLKNNEKIYIIMLFISIVMLLLPFFIAGWYGITVFYGFATLSFMIAILTGLRTISVMIALWFILFMVLFIFIFLALLF